MSKSKLSIAGVFINLDSEDYKDIKSAEQVSNLEIFSHLPPALKAKAETSLVGKIAEYNDAKENEPAPEVEVIETGKKQAKVMTPATVVTDAAVKAKPSAPATPAAPVKP